MKKSVLFFLFFFIIIFQPVSAEPFEYKQDVRGFAIKLTDWNGQPYIKKGELPPATRLMIALQYPEKHKRSSDPRGVAYCNGMCHNNSWHGLDLKKITPKEWEKYNPGRIKEVRKTRRKRVRAILAHVGFQLQEMKKAGVENRYVYGLCKACHNDQDTPYMVGVLYENLLKKIVFGQLEGETLKLVVDMPEYQGLRQFQDMFE